MPCGALWHILAPLLGQVLPEALPAPGEPCPFVRSDGVGGYVRCPMLCSSYAL